MEPPASSISLIYIFIGIILFLLLFCSALVSGSEVAFFSLTPKQIKKLKEGQDKKSKRVVKLLDNPDYLLGSILQLNNLVNILIVLLSTLVLSAMFNFAGHPVLEFFVCTISVTFILVLFGEVMPKLLANYYPVRFALFMSAPIVALSPFTKPFNFLMSRFAQRVTHTMPQKGEITLEELSEAVDIAQPNASEEKKILKGIVNLPMTTVKKIMRPRVEVVAIDMEFTNEDVIKLASECGYSRLPVYNEDLDDIKGFLYIKDMLNYLLEKEPDKYIWKEYIREAYFVPESKKISDLLEEFRTKKIHLAVVVDEYGGTEGIVTLEDILEEIVGEIVDESDFKELSEINSVNKLKQ